MTPPEFSFARTFLGSLRFFGGVVGTMLIGGAFANLTQGVPLDAVLPPAALGCIGVVAYDPRGQWSAFVAVLIGSFGLVGLTSIIMPLLEAKVAVHSSDFSWWLLALYTTCLAAFFLWSYIRKPRVRARR